MHPSSSQDLQSAQGTMAGKKRGKLLSLPILAVVSLMSLVTYTSLFIFLDRWLGLSSAPGFLNSLLFAWLAFMSLLSFFVAVLTDPGGVPDSFVPETEDPSKDGAGARSCNKCFTYKPPRTHHCRVCKRCVLKMDHHCVWINNCVGYANYKAFMLCIFHAAIASVHSLIIFLGSVFKSNQDANELSSKLFDILCGSVFFVLSIMLGSLLIWHIYLSSHNMTTIEYREAVRAMWLANKSGQKYRHRFDLGVYNNLVTILGPNTLKWICPMAIGHLKDGTQFPTSNEN